MTVSANSTKERSLVGVSSCGLVNFLLYSSRLLTGTLCICIMLALSPVATIAWLLSRIFLMELMMRLGVKSRSLAVLLRADVPERMREFLFYI